MGLEAGGSGAALPINFMQSHESQGCTAAASQALTWGQGVWGWGIVPVFFHAAVQIDVYALVILQLVHGVLLLSPARSHAMIHSLYAFAFEAVILALAFMIYFARPWCEAWPAAKFPDYKERVLQCAAFLACCGIVPYSSKAFVSKVFKLVACYI